MRIVSCVIRVIMSISWIHFLLYYIFHINVVIFTAVDTNSLTTIFNWNTFMANNQNLSTSAHRALAHEYKSLQEEPVEGFRVKLIEDNLREWEVAIFGPPETLYQGGYFKVDTDLIHWVMFKDSYKSYYPLTN